MVVAVSEVKKAIMPKDNHQFLILSLGTGFAPRTIEKYDASEAENWSPLGWVVKDNHHLFVNTIGRAANGMVDFYLSTDLKVYHSEDNYLQIQVRIYLYIHIIYAYIQEWIHDFKDLIPV